MSVFGVNVTMQNAVVVGIRSFLGSCWMQGRVSERTL